MIHTTSTVRVRYSETDAMAITHHASYVPWLELARIDMLDQIGLPYKGLEEAGYYLPVLGVQLRYIQPSEFDDKLVIHCYLKQRPTLRVKIEYEIYNGETLITTGSSDHAFTDKSGRPARPPKYFTDYFKDKLE